jgi:hypothetical protein
MTFSLRFTADLILALAARAITNKNGFPFILQLSPETDFHTGAASLSASMPRVDNGSSQSSTLVPRYRSPILWISGSEPLDHPEVPRFTNALAASGRHVFLQTSGASLKRRLHEFQPSSRFYFAIHFDGLDPLPDRSSACDAPFRVGIEALRMARLAGFFTCAHLVVRPGAEDSKLEELHAEISKLDVDGFLLTPSALSPDLEQNVNRLRRRLLSRRWALLSDLVESVALPAASRNSRQTERQPLSESQPDNFEEGAEAG